MGSKKNRNKPPNAVVQHGPGAQPQALSFTASRTEIRALPKAAELEEYRQTDPRLYDVIVSEYEKNGEHRRAMEAANARDRNIIVKAASRNDAWGLAISTVVAFASLGGAFYFINAGQPAGAWVAVLGFLPSIIAAFRRRG